MFGGESRELLALADSLSAGVARDVACRVCYDEIPTPRDLQNSHPALRNFPDAGLAGPDDREVGQRKGVAVEQLRSEKQTIQFVMDSLEYMPSLTCLWPSD